jgi:hypothetical protein
MADPESKTLPRNVPRTSPDDSDEHAHIVMRNDQMRGYVSGEPIESLCGKVWVPSRDYQGLPLCKPCVDERDRLIAGIKNLN